MFVFDKCVLVTRLCKDECTKNKWFHRVNFVVSRYTTSRKHVMTSGWL